MTTSDDIQLIREALYQPRLAGEPQPESEREALAALARVEATLNEALQIREGYISPVQKVMQALRRAEAAEARVVASELRAEAAETQNASLASANNAAQIQVRAAEAERDKQLHLRLDAEVDRDEAYRGESDREVLLRTHVAELEEAGRRMVEKAIAAEAERDALAAALERIFYGAESNPADQVAEIAREALASLASTTGASGALRDPAPGLGAGSVIDSQPSAKEPAPSTGEVSEPGADREEPSPVGGPAGNRAHGPGSLTSPAPAEPPREEGT